MEKPKHPLHLKYPDLQRSPEVAKAVEKKERLEDENVPNDPRERIEAYMDRLEKVLLNKGERVRERNTEMLREHIYDTFIIKRENVPESYFDLQKRIARERGQLVEEIPSQMREQMIDTIIEDQKGSLERWMHYLQSEDAMYPPWFKYLVFRNVVGLSQFDKELGKFKTRNEHTVAPFPDIYHEPLAKICDLYESVERDKNALKDPVQRQFFEKKFPALYAHYIQESFAAQMERGEETRGEWVKYEHNNTGDAEKLFESLQGKGTGWCTAGRSTAETQIESGDFYVYYTYDKEGKPEHPRIAIRMQRDRIAEVRGVLEHQQMEPQMQQALDEKLQEFGSEADAFRKKSSDMKRLTALEQKVNANEPLSRDELIFLYETESSIEGFGYDKDSRIDELISRRNLELDAKVVFEKTTALEDKIMAKEELSKEDLEYLYEINRPALYFGFAGGGDPRIAALRSERNVDEDICALFNCRPRNIAHAPAEIDAETVIYNGPLEQDIFKKLQHVENIYMSFPERKISRFNMEIGDMSKDEFIYNFHLMVSEPVENILKSEVFKVSPHTEHVELAKISVGDLGFADTTGKRPTCEQIYARAKELGLDVCPIEIAPRYTREANSSSYMDTVPFDWDRNVVIATQPVMYENGGTSSLTIFKAATYYDSDMVRLNTLSFEGEEVRHGYLQYYDFIFRLPNQER